jgi:hypothetical protein
MRHFPEFVPVSEFEDAKDKIMMGAERRTMVMTEQEKMLTAYHEGGHAIVALNVTATDPVHKATIIPRGRALGMVLQLPEHDKLSMSFEQMTSRLAICMGGRVSEEIVFGKEKITSGAQSDIEQATKLARAMVTRWGFSEELGTVMYGDNQDEVFLGYSIGRQQTISEATAQKIDAEVRRLVEAGLADATRILNEKRQDLETLAKGLLEYETLTGEEIVELLKGHPPVRDTGDDRDPPDGKVPDHSTFSKNRHGRFRESNVLRHLFETEHCMAEGLVGADGFAVDASLIAADANKQRSVPSDQWKPEEVKDKACRAAREYLATLDDAAFGAASPVTPKFISPSDPAAQWTGAHKGHAFFAYATNYLIDTDHGVIVDVEATRAIRQAEVGAARAMLERTEDRFGLKPDYLTADGAYGSAESLAWFVKQKKITPHIPVFDKSTRMDGAFSRADFTFDPEGDRYTCPAGKELVQFRRTYATPRTGITAEGTRLYRASKKDCDVCELKARYCPHVVARKIARDLHEDARDVGSRLDAGIRGCLSPPKKGRDAVCPSQAHPSAWALD